MYCNVDYIGTLFICIVTSYRILDHHDETKLYPSRREFHFILRIFTKFMRNTVKNDELTLKKYICKGTKSIYSISRQNVHHDSLKRPIILKKCNEFNKEARGFTNVLE
ncbi:hypothetical protein RF11_09736 [Thelohanellus kitauei]|uniref:Uncharacterized protein n=1 Tax=Thelohanellus kitauei TaxID=669202 RepID=A0A0C2MZ58_THEKT|nr:hypothetical protein RF11_09736 [Thelohanellus kitauei]